MQVSMDRTASSLLSLRWGKVRYVVLVDVFGRSGKDYSKDAAFFRLGGVLTTPLSF